MNEILEILAIIFMVIISGILVSVGIAAGAIYYAFFREIWGQNREN